MQSSDCFRWFYKQSLDWLAVKLLAQKIDLPLRSDNAISRGPGYNFYQSYYGTLILESYLETETEMGQGK